MIRLFSITVAAGGRIMINLTAVHEVAFDNLGRPFPGARHSRHIPAGSADDSIAASCFRAFLAQPQGII